MAKKMLKFKKYVAIAVLAITLVISSWLVFSIYADSEVTTERIGSRVFATTNITGPNYQWQRADSADGTFVDIAGATASTYDLTAEDSNKFIRVSVNGVKSEQPEQINTVVVFDVAKQSVSLGATYSGKNFEGASVSGTHYGTNIYVIGQSNNQTYTENNITFTGNLVDKPFDVTLDGINLYQAPTNHSQAPGASGVSTPSKGYINIPANSGGEKRVTLRLKGENCVRYICYYVGGDTTVPINTNSSLKITDISGDGGTEGSLYIPKKVAKEDIADFVATKTNYNHWNAGIGGTDGSSLVQNFLIAGGKIQVLTTLGDNCSAIGAGGNGYCQMEISGGEIIAHANGTGAAIGGGIGWNAAGGKSNVLITGGKIYAENHARIPNGTEIVGGVAIGSGSSFYKPGTEGKVEIRGGFVEAYGAFGNGIGGGNSSTEAGGNATVILSGGTVIANSIGGGNSKKGNGGSADVTVSGDADITIQNGIGGGVGGDVMLNGKYGDGGSATVTVTGGKMTCGSVIGGGMANGAGNGGTATVIVSGGVLISEGIGGGEGGKITSNGETTGGNGGAAEVYISGGKIETGSIGGGSTKYENGKLGYAKAEISGGDIVGQFLMAAGGTEPCSFTMTGGVLHGVDTSDEKYKQKNGGAVYMEDTNGVATISGGTIEGCSAVNGGAVFMTGGQFTISGTGVIKGCNASENGGAIYLGGGNLYVNGGEISSNTAKNGAAAYVTAGNVDVSGGSVTSNIAKENGGAIAINNGNYTMTGGNVDNNEAQTGSGGAIYLSVAQETHVSVYSGSISSNKAGTSGGAIAVVGDKNLQVTTVTTIGVNKNHYDENGNFVGCEHENGYLGPDCPVLENNVAGTSGGAIFITGSYQTQLNTYCLVESGSKAYGDYPPGLETSRSDFMMVEGGTVVLSTAENGTAENSSEYGHIVISTSVHVAAGKVDLYGSMSNPHMESPITVDIEGQEDYFKDHRLNASGEKIYYKLQYYENFTDPQGYTSGQYTVYQIEHDEWHTISGNIYSHSGYEIIGWFPKDENGNYIDTKYEVGVGYHFINENGDYTKPGDLTVYAMWESHFFDIAFNPNVPADKTYYGEMESVRYIYDELKALPLNKFQYPGYRFNGWYDSLNNKTYSDGEEIKNLTMEDGKVVELIAKWVECTHTGANVKFTYVANGASITRECDCLGYLETATMYPEENPVYNGQLHPVEIVYSQTNLTKYTPSAWNITPTYSGAGNEPRNAGEYEASYSPDSEATAKVTFVIDKAIPPAPNKPTYQTGDAQVTIYPNLANDIADKSYDYRLSYYSGTEVVEMDWQKSPTILLPQNYTNYIVYVRYAEDANYYASEEVRADQAFYYSEDITIFIECCEGFECFLDKTTQNNEGGLVIIVKVKDGYYKSNAFDATSVTQIGNDILANDDPSAATVTDDKRYLTNIPLLTNKKVYITLTVVGAKKLSNVTSNVTANQVFGAVTGSSASISRDSAFTASYHVTNYNSYQLMKLAFNRSLPVKTTVMLIDKSSSTYNYWYYVVNNATNEIYIKDFIALGGTALHGDVVDTSVEGISLNYQFIVDFSKTASGMSGDLLTMQLTAMLTDSAQNSLVSAVNVSLFDVPTFGMTASTQAELSVTLNIQYVLLQAGIEASKWDYRKGALVFTPITALPNDAQLQFKENQSITSYLPNVQGKFIIPLEGVGNSTMNIYLKSALFPKQEKSYKFKVELFASQSVEGSAPINGEVKATIDEVEFTKAETLSPALSITELSEENRIYKKDATVRVWIEKINIEAVTVTLLRKDEKSGEYANTGWTAVTMTNSGELSVGLGGQNPGSFCIMLTVRDITGVTILTVPFYFIVTNS